MDFRIGFEEVKLWTEQVGNIGRYSVLRMQNSWRHVYQTRIM